jgi:hypothetical protein
MEVYLLPFLCQGRTPVAVEAGPLLGPLLLSESGSDTQGSSEVESSSGGSKEVGPAPERSGKAKRVLEGSGEPGTLSVGPDWAVAAP